MNAAAWGLTLAASALMALAMGLRVSTGLYLSLSPLNSASGLGLATLSLLFACGQLAMGLAQPWIGTWADRVGGARVVSRGALVLAAGTALMAVPGWIALSPSLALGTVALAAVASAVASGTVGGNALLLAEVNRRVPPERVGVAAGLVSAGGSLGQLLIGPGTQYIIDHAGFALATLLGGALALLALPLARLLRRPIEADIAHVAQPLGDVLRDPRFWRVAASFGICGFHVSFLAVHMPGVIERCGLPASLAGPWIALAGAANIVGSLAMGLALRRHDHALLLAGIYLLRALGIAAFVLSTPGPAVLAAFALVMGVSHMATLPPTAQLVARQHGVTRLANLLGVVMLVHQVGGFIGIALGGWAAQVTGDDRLLWSVDIALALLAAALVWPLRRGQAAPAPRGVMA